MPRKSKTYNWGFCTECGEPMKLKPADRLFCKPACRYRHSYKNRPKLDLPSASSLLNEETVTVKAAAAAIGKSERSVRRMLEAGRLSFERVAGRVLVYRSQVEAMRRSAAHQAVASAGQDAVAESAGDTDVTGAPAAVGMPVEINTARSRVA